MSGTADSLFNYLRDIIYNPPAASLNIDELDPEYVMLGKGLMYFARLFSEYNSLALALSKGDLSAPLPSPENELAAPLKALYASLRHLTWQTQRVASGDYKQRVDFMGDFSTAFNTMITQLAERQETLEREIEQTRRKSAALEHSNALLQTITESISQQIFVVDSATRESLFMNDSARAEVESDTLYLEKLLCAAPDIQNPDKASLTEVCYNAGGYERYFQIQAYPVEWNGVSAQAYVINDISAERIKRIALEERAFKDELTKLHNRFSGMHTLDEWIAEKRRFALIFADLDNLKFINDTYGHSEGDRYIISAAECLKAFSADAVCCRLGGDEFMLLVPGYGFDDATRRMSELCADLESTPQVKGKGFYYSISFGVVAVETDNAQPVSDILSCADERMYAHKRERKKERRA